MISGLYIPEYFTVEELVPKNLFNKYKSKGSGWFWSTIFDARLLKVLDNIRATFGPMTINDWSWAGTNQYRGYRPPNCGVGATLSQNRFGRGADLIPKEHHPDEIRNYIIDKQNYPNWKDVGAIEMDISWLHVDVRTRGSDGKIMLFYP